MLADSFKYKTSLSFELGSVSTLDAGKRLSLASLDSLKALIPNIEGDDLLLGAFNGAVINRFNRNGDGIDAAAVVAMAKNIIHRPIDIEHDRKRMVGTILNYGYSVFGTNELLDESEVASMTDPFNWSISAAFWKIAHPNLIKLLIESNDPTSDNYRAISMSWELAFNDYVIALGSKNIKDAEIVTDPEKVAELTKYLRTSGGPGVTEDGVLVSRYLQGEILPLAFGLVTQPAAEVEGVVVIDNEESTVIEDAQSIIINCNTAATEENVTKDENNLKNNTDATVINNKETVNMPVELKNLEDLDKCNLGDISAASIKAFVASELEKASEKFKAESDAAEKAKLEIEAKAKADAEKLVADLNAANANIEALRDEKSKFEKELAEIKASQEAHIASVKFNDRMASLDEAYELDAETREIVGSEIKGLSDDAYAAWYQKFVVLAKKNKKEAKQTAASAIVPSKEDAANLLSQASIEKKNLPNSSDSEIPVGIKENMKSAFNPTTISIK